MAPSSPSPPHVNAHALFPSDPSAASSYLAAYSSFLAQSPPPAGPLLLQADHSPPAALAKLQPCEECVLLAVFRPLTDAALYRDFALGRDPNRDAAGHDAAGHDAAGHDGDADAALLADAAFLRRYASLQKGAGRAGGRAARALVGAGGGGVLLAGGGGNYSPGGEAGGEEVRFGGVRGLALALLGAAGEGGAALDEGLLALAEEEEGEFQRFRERAEGTERWREREAAIKKKFASHMNSMNSF
ncbi:hypothetical protein TeGR_g13550 [Tetraparma gracilis]|uniref:Uncharacterized protein n=1 Tax=Tetraparma gracilis TaxID=2962635 RepID=A0ABQ6N8I3_9STRA|nr:hypothetical protein TeGR_g13550 [Tetraparma gracilis]